jgi:hypothetical protein
LKIPNKKRVGRVAQDVGPEFKPQYHKNKNKKNSLLEPGMLVHVYNSSTQEVKRGGLRVQCQSERPCLKKRET